MFPSTLCRRHLKTQQLPVILNMCLTKTRSGKSQNVSLHTKLMKKPASSKFFGLKSVLEKPCFGDGLLWTVGLTEEMEGAPYL